MERINEKLLAIESRKNITLTVISKMSGIPLEIRSSIIGICEYIVAGNEEGLKEFQKNMEQYQVK